MKVSKLALMCSSFIAGTVFIYSCGGSGSDNTSIGGTSANAAVVQIAPENIFFDSFAIDGATDKYGYSPTAVNSGRYMITDVIIRNRVVAYAGFEVVIRDSDGNSLYTFYTNVVGLNVTSPAHHSFNSGIPVPAGGTIDFLTDIQTAYINISGYTY